MSCRGQHFGQLLQNCRYGNARAFDDGLAAAKPRVDLDSLVHGRSLLFVHPSGKWLSLFARWPAIARILNSTVG